MMVDFQVTDSLVIEGEVWIEAGTVDTLPNGFIFQFV